MVSGSLPRSKNWVFTLNNPTIDSASALEELVTSGSATYIKFQLESAPGTGTLHYQGYIQLKNRLRLTGVKALIGNGAHLEVRRGTHAQADAYVEKEESRFIGVLQDGFARSGCFGVPTVGPGQRNDILALKRAIDAGSTDRELFDDHFATMLRHYRGVGVYKRLKLNPRRHLTECIVLYGLTGTGKSYRANRTYPDAFHLRKPNGGPLWWDGYSGQETVIVEEFEGWISLNMFKLLIDENPLQVAVKGSHVEFCAKRVIFCSNKDPRAWWPNATHGILPGPLVRRMVAPIGRVVTCVRQQAEGEDFFGGTEPLDISIPLPQINVL